MSLLEIVLLPHEGDTPEYTTLIDEDDGTDFMVVRYKGQLFVYEDQVSADENNYEKIIFRHSYFMDLKEPTV